LTIKETSSFAFDDWIKVGGVQLNLSEKSASGIGWITLCQGVFQMLHMLGLQQELSIYSSANNIYVIAPGLGAILVSGDIPKQRLGKVDSCGRIPLKIQRSGQWLRLIWGTEL
jgi:hypothetical protein